MNDLPSLAAAPATALISLSSLEPAASLPGRPWTGISPGICIPIPNSLPLPRLLAPVSQILVWFARRLSTRPWCCVFWPCPVEGRAVYCLHAPGTLGSCAQTSEGLLASSCLRSFWIWSRRTSANVRFWCLSLSPESPARRTKVETL